MNYLISKFKEPEASALVAHFQNLMYRHPYSQEDISDYLREMTRTASGTLITSKLIAERFQSPASDEDALNVFDMMEAALETETEGSLDFRTEIGRYRFLNEVIRILSPKYLGDQTSPAVKERAVKFLELAAGAKRRHWFPSEHSKIEAVYTSLVESKVIRKNSKVIRSEAEDEAELQKSIFDRAENAAMLKKLLQSKDTSDLHAANRLIKNLVQEESKRIERRAELHSLIDRIETSTSLLIEMLSQSRIDKEVVDELADTCRNLRQKLGGVGTETSDEATSLLKASENIERALEFYDERKDFEFNDLQADVAEGESSLDKANFASSLVDELLIGLDLDIPKSEMVIQTKFDETGDNLLNLDLDLSPKKLPVISPDIYPKEISPNGLDEIGRLNRELMDKSLSGKSNSSPEFKKSDKTPLSQIRLPSMEAEKLPESCLRPDLVLKMPSANSIDLLDFDFLDKPKKTSPQSSPISNANSSKSSTLTNDALLLVLDDLAPSSLKKLSTTTDSESFRKALNEGKELLNSIKVFDLDRIDLVEDLKPLELCLEPNCKDISLTFTFGTCQDFPGFLKVAVITLTNRNSLLALSNYVFQLLPPKGLQVKLLPPAAMELSPWKKSFLPPPVLTQVALMIIPSNHNSKSASWSKTVRFILSYTADDETALHNGNFEMPDILFK